MNGKRTTYLVLTTLGTVLLVTTLAISAAASTQRAYGPPCYEEEVCQGFAERYEGCYVMVICTRYKDRDPAWVQKWDRSGLGWIGLAFGTALIVVGMNTRKKWLAAKEKYDSDMRIAKEREACFTRLAQAKPVFVTYTNREYGYAFRYPIDWDLDAEDTSWVHLQPPVATYEFALGSLTFNAYDEILGNSIEAHVKHRLSWRDELCQDHHGEGITVLENKPMRNAFDWYVAFEYRGLLGQEYHAEWYCKQIKNAFICIEAEAEKDYYHAYPFSQILSTFRLLKGMKKPKGKPKTSQDDI